MPLTRQAKPLTMQWCLDCHRDPAKHLRPQEFVFIPKPLDEIKIAFHASIGERKNQRRDQSLDGNVRPIRFNTQRLQDCYACHR